MLERITFLLAVIGYAGLTATAVLAAHGRFPRTFWRATALLIVVHVALVWTVRYAWSFAAATRNGYAGFAIFHGALALIVGSIFARGAMAHRLVWVVFPIITLGALGAVFADPVASLFRMPVMVLAALGLVGLALGFWRSRRRVEASA